MIAQDDVSRLKIVVKLRAEGWTFREIGEQLGIGAKYASQLHRAAMTSQRRNGWLWKEIIA